MRTLWFHHVVLQNMLLIWLHSIVACVVRTLWFEHVVLWGHYDLSMLCYEDIMISSRCATKYASHLAPQHSRLCCEDIMVWACCVMRTLWFEHVVLQNMLLIWLHSIVACVVRTLWFEHVLWGHSGLSTLCYRVYSQSGRTTVTLSEQWMCPGWWNTLNKTSLKIPRSCRRRSSSTSR